jgi:NAD(P)-dependent dehydrogenase (short-subunit alcohol dehydrogenase family)
LASKDDRGIVVVTGASTGIGKATALHLDGMGFAVFAGVRKKRDGDRLRKESSSIKPLSIDITKPASIKRAQGQVRRAAGRRGLAGLVNNAGVGVGGPVELLDVDAFRKQFEVNFFGHISVTQAFLPMLRKGQGRIVLVSSIGGRIAVPFMSPYNSSKFAMEALGDALRLELKPWDIKVALIEPGSIATPIWDKAGRSASDIERDITPSERKLYGKQLDAFQDAREKTAGAGIPPEKVAERIGHALTSRRPKVRYLVGSDAKRNARGASILSDRMLDRLKAREIGL